MNAPLWDLVVIGAGPGGVAAALAGVRLDASVLLIDSTGCAGGTIRMAHEVRNVPFLADRQPGSRVADAIAAMAERSGTVQAAFVSAIRIAPDRLRVETFDGRFWHARNVVVAIGCEAVHPGIEGLPSAWQEPWAESAEAVIAAGGTNSAAIVGAGDVAFDQARALNRAGLEVTVLCRSATPRAPKWLVASALGEGVRLVERAGVKQASRMGQSWCLRWGGAPTDCVVVDSVVAAVGRHPRRLEGAVAGERVRLVGDVRGDGARHVVVAMGQGCAAAFGLLQGAKESAS